MFFENLQTGSVIFTSNRSFEEWGRLFGSQQRASAILDRLHHHATIIKIEGNSYRLKDKEINTPQISPIDSN